jgi:DNA-binding beta-propeller fold protein YncE
MRNGFNLLVFLLITFFLFYACDEESVVPLVDETNNGFQSKEVAEVFAQNCLQSGCHGNSDAHHNLKLTSFSEMIKGSIGRSLGAHINKMLPKSANGDGVYGGSPIIPFNAKKSLMYNLLTGNIEDQTQKMPYQRSSLPQSQINTIKDWINNGARDYNGNVPYLGGQKIYVCNQGSDEIFEIDANYKVASRIINVDLTQNVTDAPHNVQLRGGYYYVTLIALGRLLKIDANTNQTVGQISGLDYAGMIQVTSDGKTAFVSRSSTAPGVYNLIYAIDTETMTKKADISLPVTGLPHAIWLTSDDSKLFVGNLTKDRISIVDVNTLEVIEDDIVLSSSPEPVHEPMHLYVSPDDKYLYVNCRKSSLMLVINLATKQVIQELLIKNHPMQSAVSQDGNKIYTVSHHEPIITEITKNGEIWTITREFTSEAFHHLYGADLSPDGKYLYVTCSNNDPAHQFEPHYKIPDKTRPSLVCIYDVTTNELVKILDVGSFATGIAAREN